MEKLESWDWLQRDPGLFVIEEVLKEEKFDYVISSIDEELGKLREGKIEEQRLEDARSHYKYNLLLSLDTARSVAQNLAFYATLDGDPMSLDKFLQRIDEVTAEDIARAAGTVLVPSRRAVATLSYKKPAGEEGKP
jgi:zinc protease